MHNPVRRLEEKKIRQPNHALPVKWGRHGGWLAEFRAAILSSDEVVRISVCASHAASVVRGELSLGATWRPFFSFFTWRKALPWLVFTSPILEPPMPNSQHSNQHNNDLFDVQYDVCESLFERICERMDERNGDLASLKTIRDHVVQAVAAMENVEAESVYRELEEIRTMNR